MPHAQNQTRVARNRVTLFQRDDVRDGTWQCRFTAKGVRGYIHRSTGEIELDAAKEKALQILGEFDHREKQGLPLKKQTFAEVAASYLKHAGTQTKEGRKSVGRLNLIRGTLQRYLIPYFGRRDMATILRKDIIAYRAWRQAFWNSGPGASPTRNSSKPKKPPAQGTLKQEHTVLMGWTAPAPGIDVPKRGRC